MRFPFHVLHNEDCKKNLPQSPNSSQLLHRFQRETNAKNQSISQCEMSSQSNGHLAKIELAPEVFLEDGVLRTLIALPSSIGPGKNSGIKYWISGGLHPPNTSSKLVKRNGNPGLIPAWERRSTPSIQQERSVSPFSLNRFHIRWCTDWTYLDMCVVLQRHKELESTLHGNV